MRRVSLKKPFRFYDDRAKDDTLLYPKQIIWENRGFALIEIDKTIHHNGCYADWETNEPFLYSKRERQVLNTDFFSWTAENYKPESVLKRTITNRTFGDNFHNA